MHANSEIFSYVIILFAGLMGCRLINVLKAAKQDVPESLLKFGSTVKKKQHDAYGAFFKDVDSSKAATKIVFDD